MPSIGAVYSDLPKQSPKMKVSSSPVLHSLHTGPTKAAICIELHVFGFYHPPM